MLPIIKRHLMLPVLFFCLFCSSTRACDICGCGLGSYYIGLVPQFNKKFIGLRYQYRSFRTRLASDKTQFSNDYFNTIEVWTGFNLGKKWQILAFVPYNINHQFSDDGKRQLSGLGDVAFLVNYSLLESSQMTRRQDKMIYQQLWIGGGVKLPTGRSSLDPNAPDLIALANSQSGSGSTDLMLTSAYSIHVDKLGFTANASYKVNTANKDRYRFGNRLSANGFALYTIEGKKISLIPNAGLLYELAGTNRLKGETVSETGGYLTLGAAGVELSFKQLTVGMNVQVPLVQNFASGQTRSGLRTMAHVTVSL